MYKSTDLKVIFPFIPRIEINLYSVHTMVIIFIVVKNIYTALYPVLISRKRLKNK